MILLPLAIFAAREPGRPNPEANHVNELPLSCNLFTGPDEAGAVLLLRPDVKVWIDMRTEVHGSAAYANTRSRLSDLADVPLPPDTTCAMLPAATKAVHVDGSDDPWTQITTWGDLAVWIPGSLPSG